MAQPSRLVIHAGYPKTGTTTLQRRVFPRLKACQFLGKYDDSESAETMFTHPVLLRARDCVNNANEIEFGNSETAIVEGLRELVASSGETTFLLSLEGFTDPIVGTHVAQHKDLYMKARHLARLFRGPTSAFQSCDVLLTIRRQENILPSYFAQSSQRGIKSGIYSGTWSEFLDMIINGDPIGFGGYFEYDKVCSIYEGIFGKDRVHVAPMEGLFTTELTFVHEAVANIVGVDAAVFHELLQTEPENVKRQKERNSVQYVVGKHSSGTVNLLRRVDDCLRGWPMLEPLSRRLFGHFGKGIYSSRFVVTDLAASRIRRRYAASNTRLSRRRGLDLPLFGYSTEEC